MTPVTIWKLKSPLHWKSPRFTSDLPCLEYSSADRHNQFRHYYGYHPAEAPSVARPCTYVQYPRPPPPMAPIQELTTIGSRRPIYQPPEPEAGPSSLPMSLSGHVTNIGGMVRSNPGGGGGPTSLPYHRTHTNPTSVARLTEKYQTISGATD